MSMMIDVFVHLERLPRSPTKLRDEMVLEPDLRTHEVYDARRHCRKLDEELKCIKSLMRLMPVDDGFPKPEPEPPKYPAEFQTGKLIAACAPCVGHASVSVLLADRSTIAPPITRPFSGSSRGRATGRARSRR